MTLEDIELAIQKIKGYEEDPETQHSLEDYLYSEFVALIAESGSEFSILAKALLKTKELDFPRWCA